MVWDWIGFVVISLYVLGGFININKPWTVTDKLLALVLIAV